MNLNNIQDLRFQHQVAQEIYRQHMLQRLPDPYSNMLAMSRHVQLPPRYALPGVNATLQNLDLWQQFHEIGTEMIITKSGRRMFPSLRVALAGLEKDSHYCVLLEMAPVSDCRYKFSGTQWVPAGGAEPQSSQRIYIHPDSPALGSHWQAQPVIFNKVKLTNNTLDSNGHMVLTSMHKYQPRLHIIRTSEPSQIPWAPQQSFTFPETEFVAVTAYQNDRITKLKIDNNPFAKGFREMGQSRIKRKLASKSSTDTDVADCELFDFKSDFKSTSKETPSSRKRANSLSGSTTSADDSGHSLGDEISSSSLSGTSSPVASTHEYPPNFDESDDFGPQKTYEPSPVARHRSAELMDLMALQYIQANGSYQHPSLYYPTMPLSYMPPVGAHVLPMPPQRHQQMPTYPIHIPVPIEQPKIQMKSRKLNSFSISAILGCES